MSTYLNTCSKCGHDFESMHGQHKDSECHVCLYKQTKEKTVKTTSILWSLLDNENGYYTPMAMVSSEDSVTTMMYNMSYYGIDTARNVLNGVKQFITTYEQFGNEWHKAC